MHRAALSLDPCNANPSSRHTRFSLAYRNPDLATLTTHCSRGTQDIMGSFVSADMPRDDKSKRMHNMD